MRLCSYGPVSWQSRCLALKGCPSGLVIIFSWILLLLALLDGALLWIYQKLMRLVLWGLLLLLLRLLRLL